MQDGADAKILHSIASANVGSPRPAELDASGTWRNPSGITKRFVRFLAKRSRSSARSYCGRHDVVFVVLGLGLRACNDAGEIGIFSLFTGGARHFRGFALLFLGGLVARVALTSCFSLTFLGALGSWHANVSFQWLVRRSARLSHEERA